MSNYGKRMVRESKIKEIGQGGSGTNVSGTNDGTNWTSLTIDDDTYGIPQGGGAGFKTYGLTLEELNTKYGHGMDIRNYTLTELFDTGLPILDTNIARQSPYASKVVTINKQEVNQVILNDLFGIVRQENGDYVVNVCRTSSSEKNPAVGVYAWRPGDNDWLLKNARWAKTRSLAHEYNYEVFDFTDVAEYFQQLNDEVGLYYYDSDSQEYVSVGSGTYDPDVTYYTESLGNYYPAPMTPEAYFRYTINTGSKEIYVKNGDSYEQVDDPNAYDPTETYYYSTPIYTYVYLFAGTSGSNVGVSSDSNKSMVHTEQAWFQLDSPQENVRYDNQLKVPTVNGNYVLGVTVEDAQFGQKAKTFSWAAPSIPADISVDSITAWNATVNQKLEAGEIESSRITTNYLGIVDSENTLISMFQDNVANYVFCGDTTKPFEISTRAGAWVRIGTDGSISLTSVDANTSTAHLYEFKADGIYLDNVKITQ